MGTRRKKKPKRKGKTGRRAGPYPFELRLKVEKLHLEDGYAASLIAQQFGISNYSVYKWCSRYRQNGEQGLIDQVRKTTGAKRPAAITKNIVALKKENPGYGIRRISDVLKRFFLVKASPSTVRRTLQEQGLNAQAKRKPKKNPAKPRFFERARPNQLWQSDIMTFRLAGKNAYLIG